MWNVCLNVPQLRKAQPKQLHDMALGNRSRLNQLKSVYADLAILWHSSITGHISEIARFD